MIQKGYVLEMARYNAWQNNQLRKAVEALGEAAVRQERGAFFGSIFGTLNHLLWADTIWMSRWCSDVPAPGGSIPESAEFTATPGVWDAERFRMDGRIRIWAQTLSNMDLQSVLSWYSGAMGQNVSRRLDHCIVHMFNHQTHHRGQISQMIAEAGVAAPVSDLFIMPEDV
ncbi:DinB family protein [Sulfitobacter sp. S190]|uniref:DinB family protein n=1 Tax=Sulfitobacter sp. S190 TaxID=2867022 RepID=UPI0021A32128|nr:DinB family protein [Sulfitobacter sp. S190]UWR23890.1 DUF664 domain-containing protein [Sulfitobacter sp. S190]